MHLLDVLRSGRSSTLAATVSSESSPTIEFHDEDRKRVCWVRASFSIVIEMAYWSPLVLRPYLESRDGITFDRSISVSATHYRTCLSFYELPAEVLPPAFWHEMERKVQRAIRQARRGKQPTPILTDT